MTLVPAGNNGRDGVDSLSTLAATKNGLTIGASGQADDHGRWRRPRTD